MKINCTLCKNECDVNYHPNLEIFYSNFLCDRCESIIRDKERKTYGWIFYHLLGLEKKWGRIIIKGDYDNPNQTKYGLQRIYPNIIKKCVYFYFYWGRHTRPVLIVPIKDIKIYKDTLIKIIKTTKRGWGYPIPDDIKITDEFKL